MICPICPKCKRFAKHDMPRDVWECPICLVAVTAEEIFIAIAISGSRQ